MIRDTEALGGKNISHDTEKKVSFQSLFKSCQGVWVDDIVRSEFQTGVAATEKTRLAKTVRVRRRSGVWPDCGDRVV